MNPIDPLIDCRQICKSWSKKPLFSHMSWTWNTEQGKKLALVGLNGAGKSTLIGLLLGQYWPDKGHVFVLGYNMELLAHKALEHIGYVSDHPRFYEYLSIEQHFHLLSRLYHCGATHMEQLVDIFELHEYWKYPIRHLSKGYRQRLALASAVFHKPQLLILDEPTQALDYYQQQKFWEFLEQVSQKMFILLCSHQVEKLMDWADHLVVLDQGKIIFDQGLDQLANQQWFGSSDEFSPSNTAMGDSSFIKNHWLGPLLEQHKNKTGKH